MSNSDILIYQNQDGNMKKDAVISFDYSVKNKLANNGKTD